MPTSLPSVLTTAQLPHAELQAALLDGDVFSLDQAFCSIAEFDIPWRRAMALASRVRRSCIAVRLTAAWVWGASAAGPREPDLLGHGHRVKAFGDEIVDFGPLRVTTPARTLVDLARGDPWGDRQRLVARRLRDGQGVTREASLVVLNRSVHLPYRARALERLAPLGLV